MKKLRVGMVGLGHRGRDVLMLSKNFDCCEIVAACDLYERNWYEQQFRADRAMCEHFPNAVFYHDYEEMLKTANLDVVIVETGADIHAEFCAKALETNINVLTDIPVVANLQEADRLWKASEKSTAMISVGANPNEQKLVVLLKEFYQSGKLGKPYYMEAEYLHWWYYDSSDWTGMTENGNWRSLLTPIRYCTHSLGPLLTVLDEDLRKVSCFGTGQHANPEEYGDAGGLDDMNCAQFQTESGVVVRLLRNGRCRADVQGHNYRIFGTEGYMERICRMGKEVIRYNSEKDNKSLQEIGGEFMPPAYANNPKATGHGGMDYAMMDKFFTALLNGEPVPIPLKAGLAMTLPGIYAEESAKRGGEVLTMYYPWDKEWKTEIE